MSVKIKAAALASVISRQQTAQKVEVRALPSAVSRRLDAAVVEFAVRSGPKLDGTVVGGAHLTSDFDVPESDDESAETEEED